MTAIVILAGGRGTRLGDRDKALIPLADVPLLGHILARVDIAGRRIAINANGDPGRFAFFKLPVIADPFVDHVGPLAGILAAMKWARRHGYDKVITIPVDTPFIPRNLVSSLEQGQADIICARSGLRVHPVTALWSVHLSQELEMAIKLGIRRVDRWFNGKKLEYVDFNIDPFDPFFNINTQDDLNAAGFLIKFNGG